MWSKRGISKHDRDKGVSERKYSMEGTRGKDQGENRGKDRVRVAEKYNRKRNKVENDGEEGGREGYRQRGMGREKIWSQEH